MNGIPGSSFEMPVRDRTALIWKVEWGTCASGANHVTEIGTQNDTVIAAPISPRSPFNPITPRSRTSTSTMELVGVRFSPPRFGLEILHVGTPCRRSTYRSRMMRGGLPESTNLNVTWYNAFKFAHLGLSSYEILALCGTGPFQRKACAKSSFLTQYASTRLPLSSARPVLREDVVCRQ